MGTSGLTNRIGGELARLAGLVVAVPHCFTISTFAISEIASRSRSESGRSAISSNLQPELPNAAIALGVLKQ
jgi:hypothetical protein